MTETLTKLTAITCPRKGHKIAVINRDIRSGDARNFSQLEFEPGQERIAGEKMICKICQSLYFNQGSIHTENGWWPKDPQFEISTKR
jgi:hypothetical protein